MPTKMTRSEGAADAAPDSDPIARLKKSAVYPAICGELEKSPRWNPHFHAWQLPQAIRKALEGPKPYELLTRANKDKLATDIQKTCRHLKALLESLHGTKEVMRDWPFEFQALIDDFGLRAADEYRERIEPDSDLGQELAEDDGAPFHAVRGAIYTTLMDGTTEYLECLEQGAEFWKSADDQIIERPGHRHALRQYFLRKLIAFFRSSLGKPMHGPTLAIASVYFDCEGVTPADLSKLSPPKRRPTRR
ncbi:hypothetical protein [Arenimonas sp.]|uniref:hypothetical protein n=1 Tax=Arenimonas sp. TaxID=1872635 RepID=UPI0035B370B0